MTAPAADPVAALIARARALIAEREQQRAAVAAVEVAVTEYDRLPPVFELADEIAPAAAAALEAALSYHRPVRAGRWGKQTACLTEGGTWPCAQYKAIESALRDAQGAG